MPQVRESRAEYVPEFGRVVRIDEIDRPMRSDDEETAQTITLMDKLAAKDSNDRAVAAAVDEALQAAGITKNASPIEKACAVFWWLKDNVRYVPTPGTSPMVDQTLITPCAVLAMPEPIGDCPQFSMLAAAMFRVLCMDSKYVTIAANPFFQDQWSHVYNTVEVFPGQYMPFDASEGPEPGAEYAQPFKRKVWPRIVAGKGRTKESATDMIRSFQKSGQGMRNSNLRSALTGTLGDNGDFGGETDNPADPYTGLSISSGSSGTPWYDQLISAATQIGVPLIKQQTQQAPYFVTSPTGQSVLYNPNTGTVSGSAASPLSTISPTTLAWGIGAVALVFLLSSRK